MTARLLKEEAAPPPESVSIESDFVVILASLLCALICISGLFAVVRCAWLRRRTANTVSKPPNKGLNKKVLQAIPKFKYGDDESSSCNPPIAVSASECAICLAEYAVGDEIRVLPKCGHGFHASCVDKWLRAHSSCPSCRQILVPVRCKKCGEIPMRLSMGLSP